MVAPLGSPQHRGGQVWFRPGPERLRIGPRQRVRDSTRSRDARPKASDPVLVSDPRQHWPSQPARID